MNNISIYTDKCTGCSICSKVCPSKCIKMQPNNLGEIYPVVDNNLCVNCGICVNKCHLTHTELPSYYPQQAFVAWTLDDDLRLHSASGGIASAIYKYALKKNAKCFGVCYKYGEGAKFIELKSIDDIKLCQNSKYVFSELETVASRIKEYVISGDTVFLPALPCQIAAIRSFIGKNYENLFLIDIICHGVCSEKYLDDHIRAVNKRKDIIDKVYFRDPIYGTNQFIFSLYSKKRSIYKARVKGTDVYQIGYHKALTYREGCYYCKYAQKMRSGDLTISDFSGLGKIKPYSGKHDSVSCVLVNSEKGRLLFDNLLNESLIFADERPLDEALLYEKQLKSPSVKHPQREIFLDIYKQESNFEIAAQKALATEVRKNRIDTLLCLSQIKHFSKKVKSKIQRALSR